MTTFRPIHPAAAFVGATLLLQACGGSGSSAKDQAELYTVNRAPLRITVNDNGDTKAAESVFVKNRVEGRSTIIWLIPEGTQVEKGEKLVELDASELEDNRANQEISLFRAEAAMIAAEKDLEILEKQLQSDILTAENALEFARMDQEKFLGMRPPAPGLGGSDGSDLADASGELPESGPAADGSAAGDDGGQRAQGQRQKELEDANINIQLAQEELELAKERFGWSERLYADKYITKNEYDRDRVALERAKTTVRQRETEKRLLEQFDHPKREIEFAQAVREASFELERTKARAEAQLAQKKADVKSTESEYRRTKEQYEELVEQIENAVIRAPADGLVVYYVERRRWGSDDVIEEGAEVRERQTLIVLPDVSRMIATIEIPESEVDKVRVGDPATITINADSGAAFPGRVMRLAPLPDSGSRYGNPDLKVYPAEVEILDDSGTIKPGMSCDVEILCDVIEDCLSVPQAAIHRDRAVYYCWIETAKGPVAKRVTLGASNYTFIEVKDGLQEGDRVFLSRPGGVEAPEFEQPAVETAQRGSNGSGSGSGPQDGPAGSRGGSDEPGEGGSEQRRGGPGSFDFAKFRQQSEAAKAKIRSARPELAEKLESRTWTRDPEVLSAIQEVAPDFAATLKSMREAMRRGRGNSRGQRGGGSGGRRGGNDGNGGN